MSKKLKAIESTIQPNHKEAEIWVTPTNEDGSKEVKYGIGRNMSGMDVEVVEKTLLNGNIIK